MNTQDMSTYKYLSQKKPQKIAIVPFGCPISGKTTWLTKLECDYRSGTLAAMEASAQAFIQANPLSDYMVAIDDIEHVKIGAQFLDGLEKRGWIIVKKHFGQDRVDAIRDAHGLNDTFEPDSNDGKGRNQ